MSSKILALRVKSASRGKTTNPWSRGSVFGRLRLDRLADGGPNDTRVSRSIARHRRAVDVVFQRPPPGTDPVPER